MSKLKRETSSTLSKQMQKVPTSQQNENIYLKKLSSNNSQKQNSTNYHQNSGKLREFGKDITNTLHQHPSSLNPAGVENTTNLQRKYNEMKQEFIKKYNLNIKQIPDFSKYKQFNMANLQKKLKSGGNRSGSSQNESIYAKEAKSTQNKNTENFIFSGPGDKHTISSYGSARASSSRGSSKGKLRPCSGARSGSLIKDVQTHVNGNGTEQDVEMKVLSRKKEAIPVNYSKKPQKKQSSGRGKDEFLKNFQKVSHDHTGKINFLLAGNNYSSNFSTNSTATPPNPQYCTEYLEEIYTTMRQMEAQNMPRFNYMKFQPDINEKMRGILIDWLVDVHLKFKLVADTLFITVNIIDRFLDKQHIPRTQLQLVGVTAMLIACKYEEIYAPEVRDFVYITDKAYTKEDILALEKDMLIVLGFNVTVPTTFRFLEIYAKFLNIQDTYFLFARYLIELFLVEYKMLKYLPSLVAAAVLFITFKVTKAYDAANVCRVSGYSEAAMKDCARDICLILNNAEKNSLQAVRKKFSSSKFNEVAKLKFN